MHITRVQLSAMLSVSLLGAAACEERRSPADQATDAAEAPAVAARSLAHGSGGSDGDGGSEGSCGEGACG